MGFGEDGEGFIGYQRESSDGEMEESEEGRCADRGEERSMKEV